MTTRLVISLVASFVATTPAWSQPTAAPRPNVVLIITDDLGYGDLGVYGAPDVRTPNIDRLARDGVRFTDFYSNGPLCTPTRAALISGRYQQRYRLEQALGGTRTVSAEEGLPATGRSLPQLLKNRGYATGLFGKWHLGYKPAFSPRAHGFDSFFGFKSGYVDFYRHTAGDGQPDLFEDDRPVTASGYMTDLITERAVDFVRQHAGRPFFLEVAYSAAHWPYQPPGRPSTARDNARHLMPYDEGTSTRADYVAMVESADRGVGRILRALDSVGVARNTMVIFTNDNGGEWLSRNAPFFHRKWTLWEGGIRVPLIVRWPSRVPPRRVTPQVGITMDLTTTVLAATEAVVPTEARLEGMNLLPLLEGRAPVAPRTLFWRTNTGGISQKAVRDGDWKMLLDGPAPLLFDLRRDLGERRDLAAERPDLARRLRELLAAWERDVDAEARERAAR
jgi:arylsulfatase A-like enzyme